MTRLRLIPLLIAPLWLSACSKTEPTHTASSASPAAAPADTPSAVPEPATPPPAPADLDTTSLIKDLACDGKSPKSKKACAVLGAFASASRWTGKTPSGVVRYVGHSYTISKGTETEAVAVVVAKVVPTAQVPAGYLPMVVGNIQLPKELLLHGAKLAARLSRDNPPASGCNQAMEWIAKTDPLKTYQVATTSGASVHLVATESVYLREVERRKIVIVSPSRARDGEPGDGSYSELWMASW
jgi:hypothetical protein